MKCAGVGCPGSSADSFGAFMPQEDLAVVWDIWNHWSRGILRVGSGKNLSPVLGGGGMANKSRAGRGPSTRCRSAVKSPWEWSRDSSWGQAIFTSGSGSMPCSLKRRREGKAEA